MAISVNWGTKVIFVPQSDLAPLGGMLYELDLDWFRLQLKNIEDSEEGIVFLDTHRHNTEVNLSGVIYARTVEIINGYTVEFEDGQYVVSCVGANHNLADVKVANQVSLIIGNAAGLIKVETGVSGLTLEESSKLMGLPELDEIPPAVRTELVTELAAIMASRAFIGNRLRINKETGAFIVYASDKVTPMFTGQISDDGTFKDRVPT